MLISSSNIIWFMLTDIRKLDGMHARKVFTAGYRKRVTDAEINLGVKTEFHYSTGNLYKIKG